MFRTFSKIEKFLLFVLLLPFFLAAPVSYAQTSPQIDSLLLEIWPEYDRPEALIIYRLQLSQDTPLPATLTFQLPGYLEAMNAVAYSENGQLISVDEDLLELSYIDDGLQLTFPTPSRFVQLEYYDPVILERQGRTRTIDFDFVAPYDIRQAAIQFQEPAQAESVSVSPQPVSNFTDSNGLDYNIIDLSGLDSTETVSFNATYQRNTDSLTIQTLGVVSEHAQDLSLPEPELETASLSTNSIIAYGSMGVGLILILAALGHWWWSNQRKSSVLSQPNRQERTVKAQSAAGEERLTAVVNPSPGGFCHQCGSALRPEANYCHKCGAERRRD